MKVLIVLPVYNEEKILAGNVKRIVDFCRQNLSQSWQLVLADNHSTDQTARLSRQLAKSNEDVKYLYTEKRGKGRAIKSAWQQFSADIYCFMDADLATDLSALPELIKRIESGFDLAAGCRYLPASKVSRSFFRKIFSFSYRLVLWLFLKCKIKDAPCGFKAINQKVKDRVLPLVEDGQWFFDSELIILASRLGFKIAEIPVVWQDFREADDKSKVKPISLGWQYLRQVLNLRKRLKKVGQKLSR
jgi:glycosyltransferase involved in cell wall biosynthesis